MIERLRLMADRGRHRRVTESRVIVLYLEGMDACVWRRREVVGNRLEEFSNSGPVFGARGEHVIGLSLQ